MKLSLPLIWPGKLMSPARKRNQAAGWSGQGPAALGANVAGNGRAAWPNFFDSSVDGRSISHQNTVASTSVAAILHDQLQGRRTFRDAAENIIDAKADSAVQQIDRI